jgi:energy-coupling factor transporter ATP-binding protein EcfA2
MNIKEIFSKIPKVEQEESKLLTQDHDSKTENIIIAFYQMFNKVYGREFLLDIDNEKQFTALAYYFSDNPRFEQVLTKTDTSLLDYKLNKGLFLTGDYGCGKSSMIHVFGEVLRSVRLGFLTYSFLDIDDEFVINGYNTFIQHRKPFTKYYDDFGQESMLVGNYSNKESVAVKISEFRYRLWVEQKIKTHYSSNMNGVNFKNRYTDFIYSRIKESCNIINFTSGTKNRRLL